jgi:hypothetical protein
MAKKGMATDGLPVKLPLNPGSMKKTGGQISKKPISTGTSKKK